MLQNMMAGKIFARHPNSKGLCIDGKMKCVGCGRSFVYTVDNGAIYGQCCRDGCLAIDGITKFELEISKIKNLLD